MMKLPLLHFLLGILMSLAIVASYPVLKHGAQYAQLVSRVNSFYPNPQQNGAHLFFAESNESSSSGHRTRPGIFHILVGQGLSTIPKFPRRQTNMLAMKAPSVPAISTMKPGVRTDLVRTTSPVTFLGYRPKPSRSPATFTHAKDFGAISHLPGSEDPPITRETPLDATASATSCTTEERRGDA